MAKYELADVCQAVGVRAMPVQSSEDRVENDPQLRHRGMFTKVHHPMLGDWKFQGAPFRMDGNKIAVKGPPPMIGQHTASIMGDLLGMSNAELLEGYDEGVFWPETTPKFPYVEQAIEEARK